MNANIENLFAGFSGIREVIEFVTDTRSGLFNSDLQEIADVAVEKLGLLEDGESLLEALNEMKSFIKQEQKRKSESAFTGDYSTSIRIEKIVIPRIRTLMESLKRYENGILSYSNDKPAFVSRNEIEQKYRRTDLDNILWSWRRRARFLVTDEEIKVAVAYVVERFEDSIAEEYSWMIRETIQSAINECYEMNMNTELKNIVIGRYLKLQEEIDREIENRTIDEDAVPAGLEYSNEHPEGRLNNDECNHTKQMDKPQRQIANSKLDNRNGNHSESRTRTKFTARYEREQLEQIFKSEFTRTAGGFNALCGLLDKELSSRQFAQIASLLSNGNNILGYHRKANWCDWYKHFCEIIGVPYNKTYNRKANIFRDTKEEHNLTEKYKFLL